MLLDTFKITGKICRFRINGEVVEVVHLVIEQGKYFALIAGGRSVEVDRETFLHLQAALKAIFYGTASEEKT